MGDTTMGMPAIGEDIQPTFDDETAADSLKEIIQDFQDCQSTVTVHGYSVQTFENVESSGIPPWRAMGSSEGLPAVQVELQPDAGVACSESADAVEPGQNGDWPMSLFDYTTGANHSVSDPAWAEEASYNDTWAVSSCGQSVSLATTSYGNSWMETSVTPSASHHMFSQE
jgi:hypothetical protein